MSASLFKSNVMTALKAADLAHGSGGAGGNGKPLPNKEELGDSKEVHSYIKKERIFSWLQSVITALFLYCASVSFLRGLAMDKGTWILYLELVLDIVIFYALLKTLTDFGVNPQIVKLYPYILIILRFGYPLFQRILPKDELFGVTHLKYFMPVVMLLSLLQFILALRVRKERKGKGMFVEQSEADFTRDRHHNLNVTLIINIIMLLAVVVLIAMNLYQDVKDELLAQYAALKFVSVLKYLFFIFILYRVSVNLRHVLKRDHVSQIKWSAFALLLILQILLAVLHREQVYKLPVALVWMLFACLNSAAIFYIND